MIKKLVSCVALMMLANIASAADAVPAVKLYTLDCGRIVFKDMRMFSDTDDLNNVPGTMMDPCFLIKHPRGTLMWDTGLSDSLAEHREGVDNNGIRLFVDTPMQTQLKALGLKTQDINYLAFSHFHFDHTGNARLFTSSTWLLNKTELAAMTGPEPPFGVDPSQVAAYKNVHQEVFTGDHDVFGDGSVRIISAPGHTPGHQVLLVHLPQAGNVLLTGDLYHTRENRQKRGVPGINVSRADTLASMDRVEHMAETLHARVVIQHNPQDFQALPKFPAFLE